MSHVVDSIVFVVLGVPSSLKCFVLYLQRKIKRINNNIDITLIPTLIIRHTSNIKRGIMAWSQVAQLCYKSDAG